MGTKGTELMVFEETLEPKQVPVKIGGVEYILLEAGAAEAIQYRNAKARAVRMKDGEVVGWEGTADIEAMMVSLCLYNTVPDKREGSFVRVLPTKDDGSPNLDFRVPLHKVLSFRPSVVASLFRRLQEISELEEVQTEESLVRQIEVLTRQLEAVKSKANPT